MDQGLVGFIQLVLTTILGIATIVNSWLLAKYNKREPVGPREESQGVSMRRKRIWLVRLSWSGMVLSIGTLIFVVWFTTSYSPFITLQIALQVGFMVFFSMFIFLTDVMEMFEWQLQTNSRHLKLIGELTEMLTELTHPVRALSQLHAKNLGSKSPNSGLSSRSDVDDH